MVVHLWTSSHTGSPDLVFIQEYCKYTVSVINYDVTCAWNNTADPLLHSDTQRGDNAMLKTEKCDLLFISCTHSYLHTDPVLQILFGVHGVASVHDCERVCKSARQRSSACTLLAEI